MRFGFWIKLIASGVIVSRASLAIMHGFVFLDATSASADVVMAFFEVSPINKFTELVDNRSKID